MPSHEVFRGRPEDNRNTAGSESKMGRSPGYIERWMPETLSFLQETGRATTPEEAERYLESLNRLKQKLLTFVQKERASQEVLSGKHPEHYPSVMYGNRQATADDLEMLNAERIDTINPRIWKLSRIVASIDAVNTGFERRYTEQLKVALVGHDDILISPEWFAGVGWTVQQLKQYLDKEDIELLMREFEITRSELVNELRRETSDLEKEEGFLSPGWRDLAVS